MIIITIEVANCEMTTNQVINFINWDPVGSIKGKHILNVDIFSVILKIKVIHILKNNEHTTRNVNDLIVNCFSLNLVFRGCKVIRSLVADKNISKNSVNTVNHSMTVNAVKQRKLDLQDSSSTWNEPLNDKSAIQTKPRYIPQSISFTLIIITIIEKLLLEFQVLICTKIESKLRI